MTRPPSQSLAQTHGASSYRFFFFLFFSLPPRHFFFFFMDALACTNEQLPCFFFPPPFLLAHWPGTSFLQMRWLEKKQAFIYSFAMSVSNTAEEALKEKEGDIATPPSGCDGCGHSEMQGKDGNCYMMWSFRSRREDCTQAFAFP